MFGRAASDCSHWQCCSCQGVLAGKVANQQVHDRDASTLRKYTCNVLEHQENRPSKAATKNVEDVLVTKLDARSGMGLHCIYYIH